MQYVKAMQGFGPFSRFSHAISDIFQVKQTPKKQVSILISNTDVEQFCQAGVNVDPTIWLLPKYILIPKIRNILKYFREFIWVFFIWFYSTTFQIVSIIPGMENANIPCLCSFYELWEPCFYNKVAQCWQCTLIVTCLGKQWLFLIFVGHLLMISDLRQDINS